MYLFKTLVALMAGAVIIVACSNDRACAENPIKYTALGDSVTQSSGFPGTYRSYVQADLITYTPLTNLGVGGSNSQTLLDQLTNNQTYRASVTDATIVTVEIGINDFYGAKWASYLGQCAPLEQCYINTVQTFNLNYNSIIDTILALNPDVILRLVDIWYPELEGDMSAGIFQIANPYLTQMNVIVHSRGVTASIHDLFNGVSGDESALAKGYLQSDSIHPTTLGATAIANALRVFGYTPLKRACMDVNLDGSINSIDLMLVNQHYGQPVGPQTYMYDVNSDGKINSIDLGLVSRDFGKTCA